MNRLAGVFWNREERRLRALWRLILQAAILVALVFALSLAVYPLRNSSSAEVPVRLAAEATLVLSVWLGARLLDRRRLTDFGLRIDRAWLFDCAFGMALGLFLMGSVVVAGVAAGWFEVRMSPQSPATIAIALLFTFLVFALGAVREELLSRGYHLRNMAEGLCGGRIGSRAAIVIATIVSSAIFCSLHLPGSKTPAPAVASLFLGGLLLATGYIFTGRLGLSLGLHLTWNFAQGTLFGFAVSGNEAGDSLFLTSDAGPALWTGGEFGPEGGLMGVVAVIVGIALSLAWIRVRYGHLRIDTRLTEFHHVAVAKSPD